MAIPFSIPYPTTLHPRPYPPPTANTNFCELDHQFSSHIAELINTLSNVSFFLYGTLGLLSLSHRRRLTASTALPHIGLILVGIGSALFHATLLKIPQLMDELGMAVPTAAVLARLVSFRIRDERARDAVYGGVMGGVALIYVVHCATFSNWLHYPAFGVMIGVIGFRCRSLIREIEDPAVRGVVLGYSRTGRALFVGAFGIWVVDRVYCDALIGIRRWVGLPWGWLLELHAWWHVGTGMGAFVFLQVAEYLMEEGEKRDPGSRLSPFRVTPWKGDGVVIGGVNGDAKVYGNGSVKRNGEVVSSGRHLKVPGTNRRSSRSRSRNGKRKNK